jgi:cytochrome P450
MSHLEAPLTADLITAQGVIFFAAGFETTASTLSTLSYNLAKHPEIQVKLKIHKFDDNRKGCCDFEKQHTKLLTK